MSKPNIKSFYSNKRAHNQEIKQINQSKQIDAIQKQLQTNQQYLQNQFYQKQTISSKHLLHQNKHHFQQDKQDKYRFSSVLYTNQELCKQSQKQRHPKKYSTNQQTQSKTINKLYNYNSGGFHSTQAASPYNKFSTQSNLKQQIKSQQQKNNSVKKKLFYQQQYQHSPQFNLKQSKFDTLAYTFKKKIQQYPRLFSQKKLEEDCIIDRKIQFSKINFSIQPKAQFYSKQNDSNKLNMNNRQIDQKSQSIKKRLNFEHISFNKEQNPIIKQINSQLKKDQYENVQSDKDYKSSRRNQTDMIKRKILESKSDLKRFYEVDSQNVQYEYRKAKFMDIFLGSKTIEHNIR